MSWLYVKKKQKHKWGERWGANWFYCLCVFPVCALTTSQLIKKAGLTAAEPSGRGISTPTTNWALSRRAWTGKYCSMISCSIALWDTLDIWRHKGRDLPDLALFFLLLPQLKSAALHHNVFVFYKSNDRNIREKHPLLIVLNFILCCAVCSYECSRGVTPLGGAVMHKIMCHWVSKTKNESTSTETDHTKKHCHINMKGLSCILYFKYIFQIYVTMIYTATSIVCFYGR